MFGPARRSSSSAGGAVAGDHQALLEPIEGIDERRDPLVGLDQAPAEEEVLARRIRAWAEEIAVDRWRKNLGLRPVGLADPPGDRVQRGDEAVDPAGAAPIGQPDPGGERIEGAPRRGGRGPVEPVLVGHRPCEPHRPPRVTDSRRIVRRAKAVRERVAGREDDVGGGKPVARRQQRIQRRERPVVAQEQLTRRKHAGEPVRDTHPFRDLAAAEDREHRRRGKRPRELGRDTLGAAERLHEVVDDHDPRLPAAAFGDHQRWQNLAVIPGFDGTGEKGGGLDLAGLELSAGSPTGPLAAGARRLSRTCFLRATRRTPGTAASGAEIAAALRPGIEILDVGAGARPVLAPGERPPG